VKKNLIYIYTFFLILSVILSSPVYGLTNAGISAKADNITFNSEKVIFVATGKSNVTYQNMELYGDTICVDAGKYKLIASGNVTIKVNDKELRSDSLYINLRDKKGYIYQSKNQNLKARFDGNTLDIIEVVQSFPQGTFFIDNIIDSDVCITGKELIIHPQDTAQIRPASFWLNGEHSLELPFYNFALGAGGTNVYPKVSYSNLGATVDIPVVVSLEENAMSVGHLKYNREKGITVGLEHQMRFSNNASAVFYLEDLNSNAYRNARMVYRHRLTPKTDTTLNLDWQNNKDINLYLNVSQRFNQSILTFNVTSQKAGEGRQSRPTAFDLQWSQTPDNLFGTPVTYGFSAGLGMTGTMDDTAATWSKNIGLRLTHEPIQLGNNSSLIFGAGDEIYWLTTGEEKNRLFGTLTLRLGTRFSIDGSYTRDMSNQDINNNRKNQYGTLSLTTRFTDKFSTRVTYYFNKFGTNISGKYYTGDLSQLSCFFTYNDSQNFQINLGTTYDLNKSRFYSAQGNIRFRVGNYFFLTLRPYYDFINKKSDFNFQIDPILIQ